MIDVSSIGVIGSGGWGTALSVLLSKSGHSVVLWSYLKEEYENLSKDYENKALLPGVMIPKDVQFTTDLEFCVSQKDILVLAVPSNAVKSTAKNIAPFITEGQIIVIVSKGFDTDTNMLLTDTVLSEIPSAKVAVLSGPTHAEEVGVGMPTTIVVAHEDHKIAKKIQSVFMTETFRVYTNTDVVGVEIGGAIKNIIALCVGICDGLGYGDNTKAALMTRGMAEIVRLGIAMGANPSTFTGLSGIGDLIVTCTSLHSRNRRAGVLIGKGVSPKEAIEEVKMVVEGVKATPCAYALSQKYNVDMPIVTEAYKILFENKSPDEAVYDLMCRKEKMEDDYYMTEKQV